MGDTLNKGEDLGRDHSLENGPYKLTLQGDGNLVLTDNGSPIWASNTADQDVQWAKLQEDGNFVLYKGDGSAAWASDSANRGGERLTLQADRNVVLYAGDTSIWSTGTYAEQAPIEAGLEEVLAPPPPPAPPAPPAPRTVTVAPGDTLWAISERELGDGNRYQEIANLSGIENPDLIHPGQVLTIP